MMLRHLPAMIPQMNDGCSDEWTVAARTAKREQLVGRGMLAADIYRIGVVIRAGKRAKSQHSEAVRRGLSRHRAAA